MMTFIYMKLHKTLRKMLNLDTEDIETLKQVN